MILEKESKDTLENFLYSLKKFDGTSIVNTDPLSLTAEIGSNHVLKL